MLFSFVEERNLAHFANAKPDCWKEPFAGVISKTSLLYENFTEVKRYGYNFDTIKYYILRVIWQKKN